MRVGLEFVGAEDGISRRSRIFIGILRGFVFEFALYYFRGCYSENVSALKDFCLQNCAEYSTLQIGVAGHLGLGVFLGSSFGGILGPGEGVALSAG